MKRTARAAGRKNYEVLVEVLEAVADEQLAGRGKVRSCYDQHMLSPRNAFITMMLRHKENASSSEQVSMVDSFTGRNSYVHPREGHHWASIGL